LGDYFDHLDPQLGHGGNICLLQFICLNRH
jgi:hypothetical protein